MPLTGMRTWLATWGFAVVRGRSMLPTLRDGDRLTVGVDPEPGFPDGRLVSVVDTRPLSSPNFL